MAVITRRRTTTPQTGYGQNLNATAVQDFSKKQLVTQGQRYILTTGQNPQTPKLNSPGLEFHGVSIVTGTTTDIADTYCTLSINNYTLIDNVNVLTLCPNYVLGQIFFIARYKLLGNDSFVLNFNKQDAGSVTVGFNFHYLPR